MTPDQILTLSHQLAISFLDENETPLRFRTNRKNKSEKPLKINEDSIIERQFQENVEAWKIVVENLFQYLDEKQAIRFIKQKPIVKEKCIKVTECDDFVDFNEYLIFRRDTCGCDEEELGCISQLLYSFQREVEAKIEFKSNPVLKDDNAQFLREQGKIIIDGIEINFWQKNTFQTVKDHMTWNKVKSYTELNSKVQNKIGDVVFTGVLQIPRQEAGELASKLEFMVHSHISKNIEFVVIGSENVSPSKIAQVIEVNKKGGNIKLVDENTFLEVLGDYMGE